MLQTPESTATSGVGGIILIPWTCGPEASVPDQCRGSRVTQYVAVSGEATPNRALTA